MTQDSRSDARDILLEDYRHLSESFWNNEQAGDTRVNWFIVVVGGVLGGLVTLITGEHAVDKAVLRPIIAAALIGLLVFGFVTLLRMITRNENSDRYKHGLQTIRQLLKDHCAADHSLLGYYVLPPRPRAKKGRSSNGHLFEFRNFGGLAHAVAAINSLLVGALVVALFYRLDGNLIGDGWTYGFAAIAALCTLAIQSHYVSRREKEVKHELHKAIPTHAGGVVYRDTVEGIGYLLVTPKGKRNEWVFPKGHIEQGEGHGEAALREVLEETGVLSRMVCPIGQMSFLKNGEHVVSKMYLLKAIQETGRTEKRDLAWLSVNKAMEQLTHVESKHLLALAELKRVELTR